MLLSFDLQVLMKVKFKKKTLLKNFELPNITLFAVNLGLELTSGFKWKYWFLKKTVNPWSNNLDSLITFLKRVRHLNQLTIYQIARDYINLKSTLCLHYYPPERSFENSARGS